MTTTAQEDTPSLLQERNLYIQPEDIYSNN